MKKPEDILHDLVYDKVNYENWIKLIPPIVYQAMQEYGKQQYNQAIKDAVENAKAFLFYDDFDGSPEFGINKDSILKLLKP